MRHHLTALAAAAATLFALAAPAHAGWRQHPGPVMIPTEAWENNVVSEPTVIFDEGRYRMWYTAGWHQSGIGYAESRDGVRWRKQIGPVLGQGAGGVLGVACRNSIIKHNGVYYMLFTDGVGFGGEGLRVATSSDGLAWQARPGSIIPPGGWNTGIAGSHAWIDEKTGVWHVLYDGRAFPTWKTGHAAGPSLEQLVADPFPLPIDLPLYGGAWVDRRPATAPGITSGSTVYLIGNTAAVDLPTDIYAVDTTDFQSFSAPRLALKREQPSWQVDQVADPSIVDVPPTVWEIRSSASPATRKLMYFSGHDNPKALSSIGVAYLEG